MISKAMISVALFAFIATGGTPAWGATQRIAVLVGNNVGAPDHAPLSFAQTDAAKLASVLVELGGLDPANVFTLQGKRLADVERTLAEVRRRVDAWHAVPDTRVVMLFFFSGHSDGQALELGSERLTFGDARRRLAGTGADVRLAIVDSCKSGGLLAMKGGVPGPAFEIRLSDELASSGEAILTSAAANESALESREIHASFFSHHFISGLRGAADASGDGRVTLAEAYRYAFTQTVLATADTLSGPQHPAYDYRLAGQGELVLTELFRRSGSITLPPGFRRIMITETASAHVVAELANGAALRVAVPAGEYTIRAWRHGHAYWAHAAIAENESLTIDIKDLHPASQSVAFRKGESAESDERADVATEAPAPRQRRRWPELLLGFGPVAQTAASHTGGSLWTVRLGARPALSGPTLTLDLGSTAENHWPGTWSERSVQLRAGYRLGYGIWRARLFAGAEAGGGVQWQSGPGTSWGSSGTLSLGINAGASLAIVSRLSLVIEGFAPVQLLRRDNSTVVLTPVGAWLGVSIAL